LAHVAKGQEARLAVNRLNYGKRNISTRPNDSYVMTYLDDYDDEPVSELPEGFDRDAAHESAGANEQRRDSASGVDVDAASRAQMLQLARKGGAATKRRWGCDPQYYRQIGRMGGEASARARRDRIARDLYAVELAGRSIEESAIVASQRALVSRPQAELATPPKRSISDIVDELDAYANSKKQPYW